MVFDATPGRGDFRIAYTCWIKLPSRPPLKNFQLNSRQQATTTGLHQLQKSWWPSRRSRCDSATERGAPAGALLRLLGFAGLSPAKIVVRTKLRPPRRPSSFRCGRMRGRARRGGPSFISPAARRLGCNEVTLAEIAHSRSLRMVASTSTRKMWIAENDLDAYRLAIADMDDRWKKA